MMPPRPSITGAQPLTTVAAPSPTQQEGAFIHTPHLPHVQKQDLDRHDTAGRRALELAVELSKTRTSSPETDDIILERAKAFRKMLKETT